MKSWVMITGRKGNHKWRDVRMKHPGKLQEIIRDVRIEQFWQTMKTTKYLIKFHHFLISWSR